MNITKEWLLENNACYEGTEWFLNQKETELSKVVKTLIKENKYEWANWALTQSFTHTQNVRYACYAAKQALHLFEKQFPKDKRPRLAIKAALLWASNPTEINRSTAESAAESARSAAWSAAWSAESAAWSAAWSAESAAWSAAWSTAESAADSARSAAWSAESAAWSAAWSTAESAAWSAAFKKILKYGLRLVK